MPFRCIHWAKAADELRSHYQCTTLGDRLSIFNQTNWTIYGGFELMKAILGIITALVPCLAHATGTVIFSDNFDSDLTGLDVTPAGWSISNGGTVDTLPSGSYFQCFGNAGNCVDLDGTSGKSGDLVSPTLLLTAGETYTATFELSGNQRFSQTDVVAVNFGTASASYSVTASTPFTLESISFDPLTTGTYNLSFLDNSSDDVGAILDNVTVSSPVPEPSVAWLLVSGLSGLALLRRTRPSA
jgi:hypothetical protein